MNENLKFAQDANLALYATLCQNTKGRKFPETEHSYRSVFQRDRDRIIHSHAFRRLQYKTQVFVNHEGDQYRTRLTHTLEVVQIARTIARALHLNEDLVETIALAHDIGHTPFGHAGEDALRELMVDHGGFEHNRHGLRVVDYLEERYPDFRGLNLTWEVREGIIKHASNYDMPLITEEFDSKIKPSLEAQVVDIADEIAYNNHDLDDGISSGLIKEEDLLHINLWNKAQENLNLEGKKFTSNIKKSQIIRSLINFQVTTLVENSLAKIKELNIDSAQKAVQQEIKVIDFHSAEIKSDIQELKVFLYKKLYRNYKVVRMSSKAQRFLKELFNVYLKNPEQLPNDYNQRISAQGLHQVICDYIAGMTDRYALDEYKKLFHPWEKV